MGALELILDLRRKGYSIMADGGYLDISPADNLPPELVQQLRQSKAEILAELRREKVIALMIDSPDKQRVYFTDTDSDPDNVILAIAIRHVATCEMLIPKAKYDPFKLLEIIERHGQITH